MEFWIWSGGKVDGRKSGFHNMLLLQDYRFKAMLI
jgi:hypothetical protein